MNRKPVIAIDGYSSTGKSSISKKIAAELGIVHLDTGALYRGITLFAINNCADEDGKIDLTKLIPELENIHMQFRNEGNELVLFLNNKNVSSEIRDMQVAEQVSFVAKQPEIRHFLLETQRQMANNGGIIMDGRHIGTVVLPNADFKFFLTAGIDERTRRRHAELASMGQNENPETVKENLIARDKADSEREISPLKQADDAILIDNTHLNKKETVELILSLINKEK